MALNAQSGVVDWMLKKKPGGDKAGAAATGKDATGGGRR
jgi:hypothetical protein